MKANDFKRNNFFASPTMDHQFCRSTSYNICIPKFNTVSDNKPTILNSNFHIAVDYFNSNGRKMDNTINRFIF